MKSALRMAALCTLGGALAACDRNKVPAPPPGADSVTITITGHGYEPKVVHATAGKPLQLVFKQTSDSKCAAEVKVPSLGMPATPVSKGESVAYLVQNPTTGKHKITCGMDMLEGTLDIAAAP